MYLILFKYIECIKYPARGLHHTASLTQRCSRVYPDSRATAETYRVPHYSLNRECCSFIEKYQQEADGNDPRNKFISLGLS